MFRPYGRKSFILVHVLQNCPLERLMTQSSPEVEFTHLERQKCYGPDKKILFKKQLFDLEVKVPRRSLRYVTHRLMVMHPHTKYH